MIRPRMIVIARHEAICWIDEVKFKVLFINRIDWFNETPIRTSQ
jgi:hypothetical protein